MYFSFARRRLLPVLVAAAVAALAPAPSRAQELLWNDVGIENDTLGSDVDGGLDLSGDGVPDVVAAAQNAAAAKGVVDVYDGRTGELLYELLGEKVDDHFGSAVALVPDLDGDGLAEVLVGARLNDWKDHDAGSAYLYSGKDGSLIHAFRGELLGATFGAEVALLGDVTGDGVADFAVGATNDYTPGLNVGGVYVYSGADHSLVRALYGTGGRIQAPKFGQTIADAGDVDGDSVPDMIVGAPNDLGSGSKSGSATVFSGADGHVLYTFFSATSSALFGEGAAGVGDVNGDGHADFVIAAPFETITTSSEGHVVLYSGADGSVLRHHRGTSLHGLLGATCGDAGDLDGDGIDEYLLNDLADFHGTDSGAAWLYSGRTGRLLYRFDGVAAGDEVNVAPRAADYDGDGEPDVILGSPGFDATGGNANGQVRAFHGNRLQLQLDPDAATTGATVTLDVRAATPGAPCLIAVVAVDSVAFYATLLIDYLDAQGEYPLSATVPPGLGGHVLSLQALSDDPGRPPVLSNVEPIAIQ